MSSFFVRNADEPCALHVGCMNFGKRTPEPEARAVIARALERGLRVFDTANAYNGGESERIIGRAVKADRERVAIATKVGFGRVVDGAPEGLRPERVLRAIDESLDRLGTTYVDVYYLHVPDHRTPIEETLSAMKDVLASKKARAWGVSNYASWQILEMMHIADREGMPRPVVSQQMYNLYIRQLDIEYFKFTARYPIHTTVYNPLAGGLLTGKHEASGPVLAGSRFDKNALYKNRYWTDVFFEHLVDVRAIAEKAHMTMVELAYAWTASRKSIDSILVGAATVAHLDAAIEACKRELPTTAEGELDALHQAIVGTNASYAR
jgi:aryl-alcohol dehydrogenase-like predicted oxidoreductase